MKKLIVISAFVFLAISASDAYAASTSTPNGDPMTVVGGWGLSGYQTPRISGGATVYDKFGVPSTCPAFFGFMGCFDITKTKWYEDYQTASARKLLQHYGSYAYTAFPYFKGWLDSVK